MSITLRFGLLLLCVLVFTRDVSNATGVPVTSAGAMVGGTLAHAPNRERVQLVDQNGIFVGWPTKSVIGMITIYAPGARVDQLIIREASFADGRREILLTAQESLKQNTLRATLYFRRSDEEPTIVQFRNGRWEQRLVHAMPMPPALSVGEALQYSHAAVLSELGVVSLLPQKVLQANLSHSATEAGRRSVFRGFLPWGISVLLLLCGSIGSLITHRIEQRRVS